MKKDKPLSRSEIMARIRGRDTKPEMLLRSALHRLGLRFRVNKRIEGIRADIVFGPSRVAVFVDGCFWHGCRRHGALPKTNQSYWMPKLAENVRRDRRQRARLKRAGWKVIKVWEHECETDAIRKRILHIQKACTASA